MGTCVETGNIVVGVWASHLMLENEIRIQVTREDVAGLRRKENTLKNHLEEWKREQLGKCSVHVRQHQMPILRFMVNNLRWNQSA